MSKIDKMYEHIETLTSLDTEEYTLILSGDMLGEAEERIEAYTDKAVLLDGHWLPYSQLRVDMDGSLFVRNWLHAKLF